MYSDGVEGFPLVADALRGLRGDDTWSLGGKLYRVAASPVIAHDRYAGALIVGQEVGGELAQSMKQVLDVEVAFLLRGRVLASSSQLPVLTQLPMVRRSARRASWRAPATRCRSRRRPAQAFLVVLAPFSARRRGTRRPTRWCVPRPPPATLLRSHRISPATDPKTLPWTQLAPVGGALLLAFIFGFILMRLEADRPLKRLSRDAQALARGEVSGSTTIAIPGKLAPSRAR